MIELRDYQEAAKKAVLDELGHAEACLVVHSTGTGKSITGTAVAAEYVRRGGRVLVLAHRDFLLDQWAGACEEFGLTYAIEQGERHARQDSLFGRADVVLGSKDTLQRRRLEKWCPNSFSLIVCDECFPAGTLVDGVPIEQIKLGDKVSCLSNKVSRIWVGADIIQTIDTMPVIHIFKRRATSLVRLWFDDGSTLVCTPNHPIYVDGAGYISAGMMGSFPGRVLREVKADAQSQGVRDLWDGLPAQVLEQEEQGLPDHEGNGTQACNPGRQWARADDPPVDAGPGIGVALRGIDRIDEATTGRLSVPLQDRPGASGSEIGNRDRRWFPLHPEKKGAGSQEGRFFDLLGVDRVEVLEPGRDGTFGGLCPDGHVYNLEVKHHHNYFANGILVHNCHRGIAKTFLNVFGHFHSARRLGLTATPNRTDDESIQDVFGRCVHEYPLWEAVEDKWLVPPFFRRPPCKVDLSKLGSKGDDLNQGDLEDEISNHVEELVNVARPYLDGKQMMTFTPRVASATAMAAGFRGCGTTSCSVSGASEDKDKVIADFREGKFQNLCSCELLREGVDFPPVAHLVMARPTKSGLVYRQTLGRGLRPHPASGKSFLNVIDFALNSGRHDLFRPIDLFDSEGMDTDILKIAGGLIDAGKHQDPREAIKEAERVHKAQVELRIRARARTPAYRLLAFDPFQVGALLGIPNRQSGPRAKALSAANRRRLEALKLEPGGLTNAQAAKLLAGLDDRREKRLATHRQVALLVSQGVPVEQARQLGFDAASADLDILLGGRT